MNGARQRGVALAVVVWFIAGMSLLVAGIVSHARVDTQMAQLHLARARAAAAGDGAIQLAMRGRDGEPAAGRYRVGRDDLEVRLHPAERLIDVNRASPEVLALLFATAGGVDAAEAKSLADNVVKWRSQIGGSGRSGLFGTPEAMLQVEGVTRTRLDAVRDYIIAADWAGGIGTLEDARRALRERDEGRGERSEQGVYRVDALYGYGGRTWLRRAWVSFDATGWSSLPWRVMRVEPPRVHAG